MACLAPLAWSRTIRRAGRLSGRVGPGVQKLSALLPPLRLATLLAIGFAVLLPPAVGKAADARLSEADLATYRLAFTEAADRDWAAARAIAARAREQLPAKVIEWLYLTADESGASFGQISNFIVANPDWPGQHLLAARADETTEFLPPDQASAWFRDHPPVSGAGIKKYAETLAATGVEARKLEALVRGAWVTRTFTPDHEKTFYRQFRHLLTKQDHIDRLERLLWNGHAYAAGRMLDKVSPGLRRLAKARIKLRQRARGVDAAIQRVPSALRRHPGLLFERLRWRVKKDRYEDARKILDAAPGDMVRPDLWWRERRILARYSLRQGDITDAYRYASAHGLTSGAKFAEAEWLSGWIALRFLGDAQVAFNHFTRMYEAVTYPISRARGAYWIGRAADALGQDEAARVWHGRAAQFGTTFYGQIAASHVAANVTAGIADAYAAAPVVTADARARFNGRELVRVTRDLAAIGVRDQLRPFVMRLMTLARSPEDMALVGALALEVGAPRLAIAVGKRAIRNGLLLPEPGYPTVRLPNMPPAAGVETALIYALIRQESAYDPSAISRAGARGLMQLMPATAKMTARQISVPYSRGKLITDPDYNVLIGSSHLADLLREFRGSYVLSLVAYNAGSHRARRWIREFGDPRDMAVDTIDWIEQIPFTETRNYVQRVLENLRMYRHRGGVGTEISVKDDLQRHDRALAADG